ncbi:Poly [ADP-ribose] polymerase [Fasciola gigantica]|uniref:Poly [ADP-ribose] polymerase n=1 Tax=Fasciola gigantica TaxID=46835 RepID=A0A504YVI5_FASGI|nr:Poly [ADP-ribose] polymerase [Fasciola gigantica]
MGLRVVSDELVGALKDKIGLSASQVTQILVKHTISTWQVQAKPKESEKFNPKLQDDVMRVKLKGGAAVDPESGLDAKATVLRDSEGTPMTAVLGMVDLVKGYNSYYRLQALKHDSKSAYWVFRAWGRIGTSIGGTKLEKFLTESAARQNFEDLYLEKTGNLWCNRKNFEKVPHRFYEMELDYTDVEEKSRTLMKSRSVKSKLHPLLQALLEFICDLESMKNAMVELEIDVKKMPLGKLSKRQIQDAYSVLAHLSKRLNKSKQLDQGFVLGESNRFYTLIPHDFGMKVPPLLDNTEIIKNKLKMLEDLREIELAYNILKQDLSIDMNPLDQHYRQLNTQLQPVNTNSDEFARIEQYVKLTHGSTHTSYKLEVVAVFDVERADEKARYDGYTAARHNRQLLWHGSRRTNWVGILSQGLRIAPPEAPATGYMFGKGIYFADMVSKSANYCFTSQSQPEGLLLLCEVILGNMHECTTADASPLPSGKQSRKGLGSTQPDPSTYYTSPDGVIYPIGKPQPSNVKSTALLYNEYIVYDMAQVLQKYLVRVKFVYK